MGVTAVDAMQHASLSKDILLHPRDDHLRFTQRSLKQKQLSAEHSALLWPSFPCKNRRILLRRSFSTPVAVSKRHTSVSLPATSSFSESSAAELLQSDFNPSTSAAPASGMEPQQLFIPSSRSISSFGQDADVDLGVDYKEAAAALEQLFSESPSLEIDWRVPPSEPGDEADQSSPDSSLASLTDKSARAVGQSTGLTKKKGRKDLLARVILRRKRLVESGDPRAQDGSRLSASTKLSDSIWSPAASKLLCQHGEVINFMAQNWSRLRGGLLTAEEERWLGFLMQPAQVLSMLKDKLRQQLVKEPSVEEWAEAAKMDVATLNRHLALHQAARNKLIKMNLRLVKHQARKYERESTGSSLTAVELCQEGVKGLITAVDRFDPSKGVRFSTYAVFWIRNSILRAQTRSGCPIRAPFNFAEIKMNINKARREMRLEVGEEVAAGESLTKVLERAGVDEEKYKLVMRSSPRVVSFHKRDPVTGAELIERLADPSAPHDPSSRYLQSGGGGIKATDPLLRLAIDDVLDSLKPKESLVLRQRFGLDGKGERSLGEIGRNMRISREMVRRYEARGLLKLKHPTRLAYLRSFLSQY